MNSHAIQRAALRYGLDLSEAEYKQLCLSIAFHEASADRNFVRLGKAMGKDRVKWACWFKGEWIPLIFSPKTREIVTFLPAIELRGHHLPW